MNPGLNVAFPGLVWAGWALHSHMRNIMAAINLLNFISSDSYYNIDLWFEYKIALC